MILCLMLDLYLSIFYFCILLLQKAISHNYVATLNKFYTMRFLPQFLISVILALVLACQGSVQNLSCDPEQSKGFSPRRVAEATRQAGMTLKKNIHFQTPCGLYRRAFTCL